MKILVLGGGVGGLATAIALKCIGLDVSVFEQAASFERVGAGLSLWANASSALRYLGLETQALRQGAEIKSSQICRSDGRLLADAGVGDFAAQTGLKAFAIHRGDLQTLFLEALGDISLYRAKRGGVVSQTGAGVSVQFEDGSQEQGDVLIAADGLNSHTRTQHFGASKVSYQGYTVWRGVAPLSPGTIGLKGSFEAWGCGLRFGLLALNANEVYWYAAENAAAGQKLEPEQVKPHLLALFKAWQQPIEEVLSATPTEAILHNDVYALPPLSNWVKGRVALLGDAAHAMAPNLGQGACQALEDAVVLAQCLEKVQDVNAALKHYQDSRLARVHRIQRLSRQVGTLGQLTHPLLCALRNRVIASLPRALQRRQSRELYTFQA